MLKLKLVRWAVHVAHMEEMRNVYNILVRILTHDGKRTPTDQGSRLPSGMKLLDHVAQRYSQYGSVRPYLVVVLAVSFNAHVSRVRYIE
jgi:hypothetical protein